MLSLSSCTVLSPSIASPRPIWPACSQARRWRARVARWTRTPTARVRAIPRIAASTPLMIADRDAVSISASRATRRRASS